MQPAFVLQDLMHSRLAGSRGDGVEGELKQRAGEGPLRSDGDDAAPARRIRRTQSRPNGSVRTLSSRPRKEPEEGFGLGTPAATNLDSGHNEVAARRARKLGVGVATLTLRCLLEAVSSWPRLAGASDRADAGGVDGKLSPMPKRPYSCLCLFAPGGSNGRWPAFAKLKDRCLRPRASQQHLTTHWS